ncbi:MAG: DUF6242 domain-containing protein [Dysgonamonadaceae bacterium]|jgi:hypothetical protein|nr:DUF6242 domain-containing protein [Dysgonamonadaceae bacterium]
MFLKNGFYILCILLTVSLAAGCNFFGDDEDYETFVYSDAELISWSLTSDSLPALDSVVFSIDQEKGEIFNYDSMAFGTEVIYKAIVTYTSGSGSTGNVLNITPNDTTAVPDSTWVSSGDSLDVRRPLRIRVYAYNGNTKEYTVKLNIHQVDPDSMQYVKIENNLDLGKFDETKTLHYKGKYLTFAKNAGKIELYSSTDMQTWTQETLTGLPDDAIIEQIKGTEDSLFVCTEQRYLYSTGKDATEWTQVQALGYPVSEVYSVLGYLKPSTTQKGGLAIHQVLIPTGEGPSPVYQFAVINDGKIEYSQSYSASDLEFFPVNGFSTINSEIFLTQRITIAGGTSIGGKILNEVWSTEDGLYWGRLTADKANVFPALDGCNILDYNNEIWVLNGQRQDESKTMNDSIWSSIDGGVTWGKRPDKCLPPSDFKLRKNASVVPATDGKTFYIVGGKDRNNAILPEIWQVWINKKTFNVL